MTFLGYVPNIVGDIVKQKLLVYVIFYRGWKTSTIFAKSDHSVLERAHFS